MARSIIPRDEEFFDRFDRLGGLIVQAAEGLKRMLDGEGSYEESARRIKALESEADEQVHATMDHLHRTFITPLERQDIHHLVSRLDDIMDLTEASSSRLYLYRPVKIMEEARELADVLVRSARQVEDLVRLLRSLRKQADRIREISVEIDRLENEGDEVRRKAFARLFQEENDPKELIKWKDILEHIEGATDRCEDVSDVVEGIVLENA